MLGLGVAATLAANVAYGSPFGLTGELLSGWPAAAFIGSVELLIGMIRSARCAVPEAHPVVRFPIGLELAGVASAWPAPPAVPVASAPVPAALAAAPEPVPAGVPAPEADAPAPAGVPDAAPAGERNAPEPLRQAAELFAAELAGGDVPSIRAIRSRLHVGQPKAREVQAYLETCTPAGRSIARLREEIREDAALSAQ
jgi:hypothetical protein